MPSAGFPCGTEPVVVTRKKRTSRQVRGVRVHPYAWLIDENGKVRGLGVLLGVPGRWWTISIHHRPRGRRNSHRRRRATFSLINVGPPVPRVKTWAARPSRTSSQCWCTWRATAGCAAGPRAWRTCRVRECIHGCRGTDALPQGVVVVHRAEVARGDAETGLFPGLCGRIAEGKGEGGRGQSPARQARTRCQASLPCWSPSHACRCIARQGPLGIIPGGSPGPTMQFRRAPPPWWVEPVARSRGPGPAG